MAGTAVLMISDWMIEPGGKKHKVKHSRKLFFVFFVFLLIYFGGQNRRKLTSTTGWMDLNLSHLNTVIQRSGEHTPKAVNMQM